MRSLFFSDAAGEKNSPLAHYWAEAKLAGLSVTLLKPVTIASVQARKAMDDELAKTITQHFKIELSDRAVCRGESDLVFLGTGPGAWLAVWPESSALSVSELTGQVEGLASVTDQSGGYRLFRVSGAASKPLLARGLALNLREPEFKTSEVVVSSIAHMGVIVWQIDEQPTFIIAIASSYCESFCHWLKGAISGVIQDREV